MTSKLKAGLAAGVASLALCAGSAAAAFGAPCGSRGGRGVPAAARPGASFSRRRNALNLGAVPF